MWVYRRFMFNVYILRRRQGTFLLLTVSILYLRRICYTIYDIYLQGRAPYTWYEVPMALHTRNSLRSAYSQISVATCQKKILETQFLPGMYAEPSTHFSALAGRKHDTDTVFSCCGWLTVHIHLSVISTLWFDDSQQNTLLKSADNIF